MQHVRIGVVSGVISSTGDILLQCRDQNVRHLAEWDKTQTGRLAIFRMLHGPVVDWCWRWFDARLPGAGSMRGVAMRVFADQLLLMPPSMVGFFFSQGLLEGLSTAECTSRVRESFVPAAKICLPFWCIVHTLTFSVFPPHLRMAWSQCAAVAWNALASEQNQLARKREAAARAQCE